MTWLAFEIEELRPLYEHAVAAPHREPTFGQRCGIAEKLGRTDDEWGSNLTQDEIDAHVQPGLTLVKDDGIYMMSNGSPALMDPIKRPSSNGQHTIEFRKVVYARGYDPRVDHAVWDRSRAAAGGDDFTESIDHDLCETMFNAEGAKLFRVRFKGEQMELEVTG